MMHQKTVCIRKGSIFTSGHQLAASVLLLWPLLCPGAAQAPAPFADPRQALEKAEHLADIYNWYDAHPFFVEAERTFLAQGDERNALFARASRLRGEMQILPFPDLIDAIDGILATDIAKNDPALRLRCLIIRGDVNLEIDAPAAKDDWELALATAKQIGDRKWESRAIGELGMIAFLLGDASTARTQVGQALMAAMTSGDVGAQIRYYAAIATGLQLSEEYEQAIRYFDLALNTAAKHPEAGFQYISYWGKAKSLLALKRFQEAEQLIRESLRQAEADDRRVKKVQMLLAASDLVRTLGKRDEALTYLHEALPIAEGGGFRRLLAEIYFDLAAIFQQAGKIEEAGEHASRAVTLSEEVGDRFLLPSQLLVLANLRRAEARPDDALQILERATDVVEGLLVNVPTPEHASTLIRTMSNIYVKQFELAVDHKKPLDYAFAVLERARGRVLRDVIAQVAASELTRRRSDEYIRLQRELGSLQRLLLKLTKTAERESTLRQIWEVEQKLLGAEVETRSWKGPRSEAVSLRDLRASLGANQVLVEYVWGEGRIYGLTISREVARVTPLAERAPIERLIAEYFEVLQRGPDRPAAGKVAASLYGAILAPLRLPASKTQIAIVPDGLLHALPFDMLEAPNRSRLAQTAAISFAPSASAFHALRSRATVAKPLPLLAVGNVPYGELSKRGNPSRSIGIFDARTTPHLEALPASKTEVEMALNMAGPSAVGLLGEDATEGRFKREPLEKFDIIHLAVHAFADPRQPQRGALLFAPEKSPEEDGFLQPREIVRLPIKAKLVVLSACNTTVGRPLGQEGVSNLARAFLAAGATAVLATSWSVSDTPSGSLLTEFYRNLSRGKAVAVALRDAKLTLLQRFGPNVVPTVAAFQVIGNGNVTIPFGQSRKP
jgi:CHAT domain-containing protein